MKKTTFIVLIAILAISFLANTQEPKVPDGFTSIFNGKDFTNWKVPVGDKGHWNIINGVIDYDGESEAAKDKHLWTEKQYKDFVMYVDWRIKSTPFINNVPIVLPSGEYKLDENGKRINMKVPDSDSGILYRGSGKSQVNIWCWPIGSGELYGYRNDRNMPPDVKRAATPLTNADKNIGEWNTFKITVKGNVVNVELNGIHVIVNATLPGLPEVGPLGMQHHGKKENGVWRHAPGLVQFRNIYVKEL